MVIDKTISICTVYIYHIFCSGFVRTRQQVYLIEPLAQSEVGDHAVYRREHLKTSGSTMLYDQDHVQDQGPRVAGLFRSRSWVGDACMFFFYLAMKCGSLDV